MNLLHFYSIALIPILLSIPLNAMEQEHSLIGTELLSKLTDNNKLELSTNTKNNIARYCLERIRNGLDETQQKIEIHYKLSSSFMYEFLKHDSHVSNIDNILQKDPSLNNNLALSLKKGLQNIDACPDMRLFYCFPQMVEKRFRSILYTKMGCSHAQIQKMTEDELLKKYYQLNLNELTIAQLNISITLAENILLFLQKDVALAKNILLLRDKQLNEEQLYNLHKDLNEISFIDLVDTIFNRVYEDSLDSEKTITQQPNNEDYSCSII
jgi:hypothetical protein